ncbi:hypothetical protein BCR39DRAFT_391364 [Naematelia encephala]|uniref:Uncharacterized protein n=1 Tax=Naematelia encephala TaxID=71784 RepID=A0A1Y2AIS3_9TREE|nr:hypothetical protein BCR39DRAFT_391364 [Naematelia encephala]
MRCTPFATFAYNFLLGGAAPCYKALEVAELLVHATLGPNPVLDLDLAVRKQEMSLIMFAEGNLGLCLCTRRRKPMFALSTRDILDAHRRFYGNVIKDRTYVVPLPVHEVFHRICNTTAEDVTRKTLEDLEKTIRALFNESTMPTIWSRAAMIVLCQRLHRAGPLHPLVRAMSWDIILTLDPVPCHKSEVFPLFLAGTTALLETQRIAVTARWVRAPEKGFEEPLAFLKDLWEEMNKTGNTVSWMQFMEDRNVSLAFF